ncbi:MAG: hypothetical protein ABIY50_01655 [Ignavibacteria bacterium]
MGTHHNIFTIKAISFEKGELDPFGFLEKISDKKKLEYNEYIKPFFQYESLNVNNFYKRMLDNKKLPFVYLNNWFGKFIAVSLFSQKEFVNSQ